MTNKKTKVTLPVIVSIIELLNSDDDDNYLMAYNMIVSLNWNVKSKKHIFYLEILWFIYLGQNYHWEGEPSYSAELKFMKILKRVGIYTNNETDYLEDENGLVLKKTENLELKYAIFGNQHDKHNWKKLISYILP